VKIEPRLLHRFICRFGGLPARSAEALRAERCAALLAEVFRLEKRLREDREPVSQRLHERIGSEPDRESRNRLLALRRDLFNLRPISPERLEDLPLDLRRGLDSLFALQEEHAATLRAFDSAFREETESTRRHLLDALQNEDFQGALLLSSRSLHQAQARYHKAGSTGLKARERQIERGLLRYFTRMAMKATPFATFCAVVPGALADADGGKAPGAHPLSVTGDPLRKRGHIRLNKGFSEILVSHLLQDPAVRRHLLVELNPTIVREGEEGAETLVFLSSLKGRETFQRLRPNPVVELIVEKLGARRTLGGLIEDLAQEVDAPAEDLQVYVDRLVEIGFLRLTTGIPSQELDWDHALRSLLAGIDADGARQSAALLTDLRDITEAYARAPLGERPMLLDRLETRYRAFKEEHKIRMIVRAPLFEDATAEASVRLHRSPGILQIERDLREYVELTSRITFLRRDLAAMRHFFDTRYGSSFEAVPVLRFYEDYYREHYKEHLEREGRMRQGEAQESSDPYDLSNPFDLDLVTRLLDARRRLATLIAERWTPAGEDGDIDLTAEDLREALRGVEPIPSSAGWSVTVYGDLVPGPPDAPDTPDRIVIRRGGYVTGYGKMLSRFLYLFPPDFEESLRRANSELTRDTLAELCDDANFNANLHPPLLPEEIRYPTAESRGTGDEILPSDLLVIRDPRDPHSLALRHAPTGRQILPVDTGFMSPEARPPLYRLLSTFTPSPSFMLPLPVRTGADAKLAITVRPRITFNRRLVLFRKSWLVPGAEYPRKQSQETERDYFLRLARWRREHGVPGEVYVSFQAYSPAGQGKPGLDAEAQKPQYVDFESPLLVSLFGHMAPDHDGFMALLEERLPSRESLFEFGGEGLVTELVLQMDFPEAW
jgi:hypothetical protein